MKAKYEKMIDEYVKKHYGDLDRGVLAPEVKYKVLFKLYRKKYRKEKNMREHLEETVKDWCNQNNALKLPEDLDRKLFPWHLAPSPDKVLPKEDGFNHLAEGFKKFLDLHEVCGNCIHFREGKGKGKSTCAKHDKFVPKSGSCYEFEDKEKAQSSYLDWLHDDITWCCRKCSNTDCERNKVNMRCKTGLHSVADMFDPFKCPIDAEMPERKK